MANADVTDKQLIEARRVVLTMTSKHPVLRERLLSRHGRYYLILHSLYSGLPEDLGAVRRTTWGAARDAAFPILPPMWSRRDPDDDERDFPDVSETPDSGLPDLR